MSAKQELGGGVLLELSHEIDYLRWIFGEVDWVSSWVGDLGYLEIDVEDTAQLILGFKSKSMKKPVIASVSLDFIRRDKCRLCTVIGDCGSLRWNGVKGVVDIFEPGAEDWRECVVMPHQSDDSYRSQSKHFLTAIEERKIPLVDGKAGLAVLQIIEAAKLSSQNKGIRQRLSSASSAYG